MAAPQQEPEPPPAAAERVSTVVVGAGVCGLKAASRLMRDGSGDFVLLEQRAAIGGVWGEQSMANKSSRVQIAEPNYRLIEENVTEEFTPQEELLEQMYELAARDGFEDRIRCDCSMTSCRAVDASGDETLDDGAAVAVRVTYTDAAGESHTLLASDHVLLCTGGLQTPRDVALPEQAVFGGDVILGIGSEVDNTDLAGKHVAVLGMGAFAVENARTALMEGADHVTMVARHYGMVLPRLLVGMGTIQAGADTLYRSRGPEAAAGSGKEGSSAGTISVAGFATCPFHQKALEAAKQLVASGDFSELEDLTSLTRDEYQGWLKDAKPTFDDARAATHTSSPFVYSGDNFIGGCDDTLALLSSESADEKKPAASGNPAEDSMLEILATPYKAAEAMQPGAIEAMPTGLRAVVEGKAPMSRSAIFPGSTIPTVSDMFFVALALGRVTVELGEVVGCDRDGVTVRDVIGDTGEARHVPCDVIVKCFGFENPDSHLGEMVNREFIHSPMYITPKIILMKGERNTSAIANAKSAAGSAAGNSATDRGGFNVGGSVIGMSDFYLEVYAYFKEHPEGLGDVLKTLPRPKIHDDSFSDMGVGCAEIVAQVPELEPQLDVLRAKYGRQIATQYAGGLSGFIDSNREQWKESCRQLSPDGDENAVPYVWDGFIKNMITTVIKSRLPWPVGVIAAGVLQIVPLSWLPLPGPPKPPVEPAATAKL